MKTKRFLWALPAILLAALPARAVPVHVYEQTLLSDGTATQLSDTILRTGSNYVTQAAPAVDGWIFTHWSISTSQEFDGRDRWGRARETASYLLQEETTLTANYLPASQDSDADGVADGWEIYWYGNLSESAQSDTDGDSFTFADELTMGMNPYFFDEFAPDRIEWADSSPLQSIFDESLPITPAEPLTILAESDLEPGVTIRITGATVGWTRHYTTDGSNPTAESPEYAGPFVLDESATVKVVAVSSDGNGLISGVVEQRFDLASPLAVTGARARQRYPWNGLVDVDFTLEGDAARRYRVTLVAEDLDGGTNLAVRTVWEDRGSLTNATLDLVPGDHRLVWNAGADLPEGFVGDRVTVSLRAESIHDTALYMAVDLSGGPDAANYPVSYLPDVPDGGWTDEYKTDKLVLRRVEPGNMETCDEPMFAAVFETTQGQFEKVTNSDPSQETGALRPVDSVSYDDLRGTGSGSQWPVSGAVDDASFIGVFRGKTGLPFDLPNARQWEYVCRAGTTSDYNNGGSTESDLQQAGRYSGNLSDGIGGCSGSHTTVGAYRSNAWSLYDMHGNVQEWCLDWFGTDSEIEQLPNGPTSGPGRVVRGGGFGAIASECKSSGRGWNGSSFRGSTTGFRLFLHDAPAVVEAPIVAPAGLTATTNRTGDVALSWEPVAGAYAYQIRRSKTGAFEDGTWLNTVTNTTYADWTAESRTDYAYWVRAQFESGRVGVWSEATEGSRHKYYTVHFDANGGTGTMEDLELRFDQPQALTGNAFAKSDNVFVGWATTAGGSVLYADGETVENLTLEPGAVVTLYACWASSSYTVKFNKNASAATGTMSDQTMARNAYAALRANAFVRVGYKFAGWATSASGAKVYDDKQSVKNITTGSSITLYAVWEALSAQNALYMVIDLSDGVDASSYPVSYLSAVPSGGWSDEYKTTKLLLRRVEAGSFTMGSPASESGRQSNETQHLVTISKPLYVSVFELTEKQYAQIAGGGYSSKKPIRLQYSAVRGADVNYTVTTKSINSGEGKRRTFKFFESNYCWPNKTGVDASSLVGKLRARTGLAGMDLPTEAQWEFACRGGSSMSTNYGGSVGSTTLSNVGTENPNSIGLYDMLGNAFEWCLDGVNSVNVNTAGGATATIPDYGTAEQTDPVGGNALTLCFTVGYSYDGYGQNAYYGSGSQWVTDSVWTLYSVYCYTYRIIRGGGVTESSVANSLANKERPASRTAFSSSANAGVLGTAPSEKKHYGAVGETAFHNGVRLVVPME